ncbi:MAG: hypothetical protein HQK49_11910 [Oligoflexia bacterium]|nr:hypothetical protein [Oligoflexia bacterium]
MSLNIFIPIHQIQNELTAGSYLIQTITHLNEVLTSSSIPHSFTILYSNNDCSNGDEVLRKLLPLKKFEQRIDFKNLEQALQSSKLNSSYICFYPLSGTHHSSLLVEIYNLMKKDPHLAAVFLSRFENQSQLINYSDCETTSISLTGYLYSIFKLITLLLKFKLPKLNDFGNDLAIYRTDLMLKIDQAQNHNLDFNTLINLKIPLVFSNIYANKIINYPDKNIHSWIQQKMTVIFKDNINLKTNSSSSSSSMFSKFKTILKHTTREG